MAILSKIQWHVRGKAVLGLLMIILMSASIISHGSIRWGVGGGGVGSKSGGGGGGAEPPPAKKVGGL